MKQILNNQIFDVYLDEIEKTLSSLPDSERLERREEMRQHLMALYEESKLQGFSDAEAMQKTLERFGESEKLSALLAKEQEKIAHRAYRKQLWIGQSLAFPIALLITTGLRDVPVEIINNPWMLGILKQFGIMLTVDVLRVLFFGAISFPFLLGQFLMDARTPKRAILRHFLSGLSLIWVMGATFSSGQNVPIILGIAFVNALLLLTLADIIRALLRTRYPNLGRV
jgi:hypothetical protein